MYGLSVVYFYEIQYVWIHNITDILLLVGARCVSQSFFGRLRIHYATGLSAKLCVRRG